MSDLQLLHIDTSTDLGSVAFSKGNSIIDCITNPQPKDHGSFLQPAIQKLMQTCNFTGNQLDAIVVAEGPGSYTGLRVAMASAKGLAFAWGKPLITVSTLGLMTQAAIRQNANFNYWIPMIDARRMEVFTAVFDATGHEVLSSNALILNESSYIEWLQRGSCCFFGSGSSKWKSICKHKNAAFIDVSFNAGDMLNIALYKWEKKLFSKLESVVPNYGKEFYSTAQKPK